MNSIHTFASTVREDLIQALGVFSGEGIPPGGYFSREMVTLYAFVFISSALVLKPVRKLLFSAVDTLVAIVLLGIIGSVVLGIPFAITYLSFRGLWYVCQSIFEAVAPHKLT